VFDLHCHLLPGVDDGPRSWDETLELCRQLTEQGISTVVATPHYLPGGKLKPPEELALVNQLQELLNAHNLPLKVYAGAEVYLTPEVADLAKQGLLPAYNPTYRYLLVELPLTGLPRYAEDTLFRLALEGYTPILAHPERNQDLIANRGWLEKQLEQGLLVQVNAESLTGRFGSQVKKSAQELLAKGWVHFLGSDAHHPTRRPCCYGDAAAQLKRLGGPELANQLTIINPREALLGSALPLGLPAKTKRRPFGLW